MVKRLSAELEREVRRLEAELIPLREIGRMVECSKHGAINMLARDPQTVVPAEWNLSSSRLSMNEREEIRRRT